MGAPTGGAGHGDRGLATERTRLAWRRTTLAATVVAVVGVGRVVTGGARPIAVAGLALVALVWLAIVAVSHRRIRALAGPAPPDAHRAAATLALLTAAVALFGLLLVV